VDYGKLTDDELRQKYEYHTSQPAVADERSFDGRQAAGLRREIEARQQFQRQVYSPLQRVQEAAAEASRARDRIEAKPFSEAANPWDFGLGWSGLGMVTAQRKPQDVRYAEHALAKFVDGLDGVGVPYVEPWAPGQKELLEEVSGAVAPLAAFRDSWASDPKAMERLKSAYDDDGLLGNTSGLTRAGVFTQAPLSALYNQVQYAAGVPKGDAEERALLDQMGMEGRTFFSGMNPASEPTVRGGPGPARTRWDLMDQYRKAAYDIRGDWRNATTPQQLHAMREMEVLAGIGTTGPEFFGSMGVPEGYANVIGTALDLAADPNMGLYRVPGVLGRAARYASPAAKTRRYAQAAGLAASDVLPPALFQVGGRMVPPVSPANPVADDAGPVIRMLLAR
jgi:hypothetical protein